VRLLVTTPTSIKLDVDQVRHVRAEDSTGAFGVRSGHADFLTVLSASIVSYDDAAGVERFVAVHGGVLRVRGGSLVQLATSAAFVGDNLDSLKGAVLARLRAESEAEATSRSRATELHLLAIRGVYRVARGTEAIG
jgi:F-type H+-transporting ATPase subunit epsilon